jgi:hypothetical protein
MGSVFANDLSGGDEFAAAHKATKVAAYGLGQTL